MESWLAIVISLCIGLLVKAIVGVLFSGGGGGIQEQKKLPPGPHTFPIIGSISWLRKSSTEMEAILRKLHSKYGPLVTLRIGGRPAIFVADSSLAHQALVQNGAVFADRPPALLTNRNQLNINSAHYGPTWRLLRRNLTAEILHPSRIKSYSDARRWVLHLLLDRLRSSSGTSVRVVDHFHYAMFCLLVLMCFGDKLDEPMIKEIETVQRSLLLSVRRFSILNFWPKITGILLRRRWQELFQLRRNQEAVLAPLIEARRKANSSSNHDHHNDHHKDDIDGEEQGIVCYVDTLLDLQLPEKEEKTKLETGEIVTLCSEFLVAGTDTTSTALQWIMANIVKHPEIQEKLYAEMKEAAPPKAQVIEEEDLRKMEYLKAVVLEGLRRHPPGHFVLPHAVTEEEVVLGGHAVPKEASINFMVAEIGWDPKVWQDPMAFRPERFLGGEAGVDITGSKEIKMVPFGAGRRICPGFGLAMLHLEYFVANLVWSFEWKAVEGDEVDMSEKQEFTTVMKYPLKAKLYPRL